MQPTRFNGESMLCVLCVALGLFASSSAPAAGPASRPAIVPASQWGSSPQPIPESRRHTPKFITIHHAGVPWRGGDPQRFVRNMQIWGQREKNWPDLPYHFLIAPDGRIFEGRPLEYEPESNTRYELAGNIGVEMMGDFEQQRPSRRQLESCARLVAWLAQELKIPPDHIRGHKDAAPGQTTCPGRDFYRYLQNGQFRSWVAQLLEGREPMIEPGPPLETGPTTRVSEE
ncbi:peptidoglycan recognition protein family protein [Fontivita pretiosa]|uniref:peptidoglycan recognition protein family protein n=1 Tax=Fontivita pretiosa TaxID=2989684 RepID=UPI003D16F41C